MVKKINKNLNFLRKKNGKNPKLKLKGEEPSL